MARLNIYNENTGRKLQEYEKVLASTDWSYRYADGSAYYKGAATVRHAKSMCDMLCEKYPESSEKIKKLLQEYRF